MSDGAEMCLPVVAHFCGAHDAGVGRWAVGGHGWAVVQLPAAARVAPLLLGRVLAGLVVGVAWTAERGRWEVAPARCICSRVSGVSGPRICSQDF